MNEPTISQDETARTAQSLSISPETAQVVTVHLTKLKEAETMMGPMLQLSGGVIGTLTSSMPVSIVEVDGPIQSVGVHSLSALSDTAFPTREELTHRGERARRESPEPPLVRSYRATIDAVTGEVIATEEAAPEPFRWFPG